jgi:hypothetical protein
MDTFSIVMHIVGMIFFVTFFGVMCYKSVKDLNETEEWLKDMKKDSKEGNPLRKV